MGSEISSLIIEPILGIIIAGLSINAIMKQNSNEPETARWEIIGAIALTFILIILNIILSMSG